jgi:uncharacterized protein YPO0396
MNLSLFSTKPGETGFRLHSFEVLNWGTFDKYIYRIEPLGETSLLTGANASGKTTLIDGLLTLLVPERRMRFYNQTAGSKGERTEESYVIGEYGETENADTKTRETKKLRADKSKTLSVLLAVFQNESNFISLVQVRWFSGGELKKVFILAHKLLTIDSDFSLLDNNGDWKKRLKQKYPKQGSKETLTLLASPGEYSRLMRKVFGMRTEKAHTLFSQTIGLKVLGNLDEFVRFQMLEERDAENEFQRVKSYFKTLNDAHKAIEKVYKQIELLRPIRDKANQLSAFKSECHRYEDHQNAAPLWFAQKQEELITIFINDKNNEVKQIEEDINIQENEIGLLSEQERELSILILNDEVGKQISALERRNKDLESAQEERESELKRYNELSENLGLQINPQTKELFDEQRKEAIVRKKKAGEVFEQHIQNWSNALADKKALDDEFDKVSNELVLLRSQKNNITGSPARIRSEILEYINATEKEIPFIGELIKVNNDAKEWEPAIERLLHNFALRLLVPEEYYQLVNNFVNDNDLKGRIIYHKFSKKEITPVIFKQRQQKDLIHKLEFKNSDYSEWVKCEIENNFDYICTEDLEEFRLSKKALLKSGLIKNQTRHEKDDRPEIRERQQYVLGWDNKEKIAVLRQDAELLSKEIKQVELTITHLKNQQLRIKKEEEDLARFTEFNNFKRIDWWSLSIQVQENVKRIEELQKTNNRIKTLKEQREKILSLIKEKRKELDSIKSQFTELGSSINQQRQKLTDIALVIDNYSGLDVTEKIIHFQQEFIKASEIDVFTIERVQKDIIQKLNSKINELKDLIRIESSLAETLMRTFNNPGKEINEKFPDWSADTHRLRESAEFIDEYIALLEKIEKQELAEYKQQFKKYLNEEMITKMSDFQTWLERQEEDIEEKVDTLNKSLEKINFKNNPPTFIRLQAEKDYSPKVKEFKSKLHDWKPNIVEFERTKDDKVLEESFNKIKSLLDDLTNNENVRKEVLDVRNWLKFRAVEHHREDRSKIFRTYTGTAKLSGGEGAQLTYTILGSAIAYQFGIHSEGLNTNSFRFICVDEAFSKQDDEKAQFLMELCKQLHLQLMVVSPAKAEEVAIVEPYIARVHFVQRKDNRHSVVFDMPIKQLQEHRQQYIESVG